MQALDHREIDGPDRPGNSVAVLDVATDLSARYDSEVAQAVLRAAVTDLFRGRVALVSSFGADSAVLLHMVSQIDLTTPVLFIDTGHLFPETLTYRDALIERLGLTNCRTFAPDPADLEAEDPEAFLWATDQNTCCNIRKVRPLARSLVGYDAWISGRKRFQASTRAALSLFEGDGERTKINPLLTWSASDIRAYMDTWSLPSHPLVAKKFLSIGCMPCTSPVRPGEDARAGRWRGTGKVECGIHNAPPFAGMGI